MWAMKTVAEAITEELVTTLEAFGRQTDSHTATIRGTKWAPSKDGPRCTQNSPSGGQPFSLRTLVWTQKGIRETTAKFLVLAGPVRFVARGSSFRRDLLQQQAPLLASGMSRILPVAHRRAGTCRQTSEARQVEGLRRYQGTEGDEESRMLSSSAAVSGEELCPGRTTCTPSGEASRYHIGGAGATSVSPKKRRKRAHDLSSRMEPAVLWLGGGEGQQPRAGGGTPSWSRVCCGDCAGAAECCCASGAGGRATEVTLFFCNKGSEVPGEEHSPDDMGSTGGCGHRRRCQISGAHS
ncbi:uncharacterized protein LOC141750029 [Larus michahellis]|uniref:uncharacterized protein LOC141750029 n=1 Tax=Larus michahellis TaxID=119627 RepID=UPI003D9BA2B7